MINAIEALQQSTANKKSIEEAQRKAYAADEAFRVDMLKKQIKEAYPFQLAKVENSISKAVLDGKTSTTVTFNDNSVERAVVAEFTEMLRGSGYGVYTNYSSNMVRLADDMPEEECFYMDMEITW